MRFNGASEPMLVSHYREMMIRTTALVPQAIFRA
jgi:hypothetical protein